MPELPEVEAVATALRPLVAKRRIRCAHIFHPIATRPQPAVRLVTMAEGRRIEKVSRLGKNLLLELDRGVLLLHFKLDGQLLWFSNARELMKRANAKPGGVHVDVAFELNGGVLGFADGRHFGRVTAWDSKASIPGLRKLGVDALSREFTPRSLRERLAKSIRPVKEFLLDQTKVAGVGNIYSGESLWHSRISPLRRANSLSAAEASRLHKAIVSVLRRALECCLHPAPDFSDPSWWFQGLDRILRVYGREGERCRRCGHAIQRIEQAGRSTYYCPHCQH